jgi:hypothetical protein
MSLIITINDCKKENHNFKELILRHFNLHISILREWPLTIWEITGEPHNIEQLRFFIEFCKCHIGIAQNMTRENINHTFKKES